MVLSRLSEAGGRGAGGFLGGIANNPGVIIIVAIVAALVLFRGDIRQAFGDFGKDFGKIELPSFPDITFPTFEFPTFKFPDITFPTFEFPTFEFPDITFPTFEFPDVGGGFTAAGESVTDFFTGLQEQFNQFISGVQLPEIGSTDFTESGMAAARGARGGADQEQDFVQVMEQIVSQLIPTAPSIQTDFPFIGGGPSFEGGQIFETPIENLSLSQIIDRFMVSATRAASIRAEAIGFTETEQAFLEQGPIDVGGFVAGGPAAVSDPAFAGLTPEQIAIQLTGGNIQNFA